MKEAPKINKNAPKIDPHLEKVIKSQEGMKRYRYSLSDRELKVLTQRLAINSKVNQAHPMKAPQISPNVTFYSPFQVFLKETGEQTIIDLLKEEETFYKPEIDQANALLNKLKYITSFDFSFTEETYSDVLQDLSLIRNDSLRRSLFQHLQSKNLPAFVQDLSDYFSLDKPFEKAAAAYTLRYPHKRNLQTLRLLHNPFINESFKTPVKFFLQKKQLELADIPAFEQALRALQGESERILARITQKNETLLEQALAAPYIQRQLEEYNDVIERTEAFVDKTGRLPSRCTRSAEERDLAGLLEYLASPAPIWRFEPFLSKQQELRALLKKYEPKRRSSQETIEAYRNFVQTTGKEYPRPLDEIGKVPHEEGVLFDDLMYWRIHDQRIENMIREITQSHAQPNDLFYH